MDQNPTSFFLQLLIKRPIDIESRPGVGSILSNLLPVTIDHEIVRLDFDKSASLTIIILRFSQSNHFKEAQDYFEVVKSVKFGIFDIVDIEDVSAEENERLANTYERKSDQNSKISDSERRLLRLLYDDEQTKKVVDDHRRKLGEAASKSDFEAIDQLRAQLQEFENRRKFFADRILESRGNRNCAVERDRLLLASLLETKKLKASLPIYARRSEIKETIKRNRVCVIVADTGSGKSTQVPQYLLELADDDREIRSAQFRILCTQPRKVAAIGLAQRVADELDVELGFDIGYRIGGAARGCRNNTRLTFTTDAFLLRECLRDRLLTRYNCVIVDEAHERSLDTDLALGMLKRCLKERPADFRVIIMSATVDPKLFVSYFQDASTNITCGLLTIPGRCYPVEDRWVQDESESASRSKNVAECLVKKVKEISSTYKTDTNGAILAFLTTPAETELASRLLAAENQNDRLWILQLHGRLQADEQRIVFDPCPKPGQQRKVVFATNSAETSITIPDVRFVVDSGLVKEKRFDAKRNTSSLAVGWTSKSSAKQRAGRAGRTGPGVCYHLYTKDQFEKEMPNDFVAEIRRTNMSQTLLYLFALEIDDPMNFDFIEKPSMDALINARSELIRLGALTSDGRQLTEIGRTMSKLTQVEPRLSKLLILVAGKDKARIKEACAMVSCIATGNIFFRCGTDEQKNSAGVRKMEFCDPAGDPITYLNVYDQWSRLRQQERGRWCADKYINGKCMKAISETFDELRHAVIQDAHLADPADFDRQFNIDAECASALMKTFAQCFLRNLAMYTGHPRTGYFVPSLNGFVDVHPSSAICFASSDIPAKWITFEYVLETTRRFAFDVAIANESWLNEDDFIENAILDECEKWALGNVQLNEFGRTGKMHITRSKTRLEESAKRAYDGALCFVEYAQPKDPFFRLILYAPKWCLESMQADIRDQVAPVINDLEMDFKEVSIRSGMSTRICLGPGGDIENILMRDEFRTVAIHNVPAYQSSLDAVLSELAIPKDWIRKSRAFEVSPYANTIDKWGTIGFCTPTQAAFLVQETENRPYFNVRPSFVFKQPSVWGNRQEGTFRILISWCRRPSLGSGVIKMKKPDDVSEAIFRLSLSGEFRSPQRSKKRQRAPGDEEEFSPDEIHIRGVSKLLDDNAFTAVCRAVLRDLEVERAYVLRKKGYETKEEDLERFHRLLSIYIENHTDLPPMTDPASGFTIRVLPPRNNGEVEQRAVCTVSDLSLVGRASKLLGKMPVCAIDLEAVKFVGDAREQVTIPPLVYPVIKEDLEKLQEFVRLNVPTTELKIETLKSGRIVAMITSGQYTHALHVRALLQDNLRGDVIECPPTPLLAGLFKDAGIKFLKSLEKEFRVHVHQSFLRQQIIFYGSRTEIERAKMALNSRLDELHRAGATETRQMFVKPPTYPANALKTLLAQNQYDLDTLTARLTDCFSLKVDPIKRRLDYTGSDRGFRQLENMLRQIATDLAPAVAPGDVAVPDCSACICPVEPNKNYCLETCGHYYCNECILNQLKTALEGRRFPIVCAQDGCEKPFVIKDFDAVLRLLPNENGATGDRQEQQQVNQKRMQAWEPIIDASVAAYIAKHKEEYCHCVTPDCHGVYRKTPEAQLFHCDSCGERVCSKCGVEFHAGESCETYAAMKRDNNLLEKWYQENPDIRKPCPKCKAPIEKNGGCMHMTCDNCKIHICWRCMATFNTDRQTYGHLRSVHGRIM